VLQTAQAGHRQQWNVHEMRFYHHGQELARRPDWRLRAWPNPWEVQLAFDNTLATRWRSGEIANPGMFLDVDFGRDEPVDEVRLIMSFGFDQVRLQLESANPTMPGGWEKIAESPTTQDFPVPQGIRRLAVDAMQARGIHYLLIHDGDGGAEDFARDPAAWGLKLIEQGHGVRLFRTIL
jgi:hypothetical protein